MTLVYTQARKSAKELLDLAWDGELPVRLRGLTDYLRAEKVDASLGAISGAVSKESGRAPVILINKDEPERRRRFTWAHELGHIVERGTVAQDDDYSFSDHRGREYDLHEFYADEFAGALLMPEDEFLTLLDRGVSDRQMARIFDVSVPAVRMRRKRLRANPTEA